MSFKTALKKSAGGFLAWSGFVLILGSVMFIAVKTVLLGAFITFVGVWLFWSGKREERKRRKTRGYYYEF